MKTIFHAFLLVTVLGAIPVYAEDARANNSLDNLLSVLNQFTAESAVSGLLAVEVTLSSDDDDDKLTRSGTATVRIAADADGVSVHLPAEQIEKIRQSGRSDDSDSSPSAALQEVNGILADELLNAAETIKRSLKHAEFESEKPAHGNSPGAREWVFLLKPPMSDRERKRFRELDLTVTILTDPEGIPVEARVRQRMRSRVMLVSFEMHSDEHLRFEVIDDRLVTTYHKKEESVSGMGQSSESTKTYRLVLDS
jgi:hypothetical protein